MMDIAHLFELGARVGDKLVARGETVAVAGSSAGGLVLAALLSRAGASACCLAGPTGSTCGDPAGYTCVALDGPVVRERVLRTGVDDRSLDMRAFAVAALALPEEALDAAPAQPATVPIDLRPVTGLSSP